MFRFKETGRDESEKEGHKFYKQSCIVCGNEFWPKGPSDLCCSDECRAQRIRDMANERNKTKRDIRLAENDGHLYPAKACEWCGTEYWPTKPQQHYCSEECLSKSRISQRNEGRDPADKEGHPYFKRKCVVCGKEFWPTGPNQRICSDECRHERTKQQMRRYRDREPMKEETV